MAKEQLESTRGYEGSIGGVMGGLVVLTYAVNALVRAFNHKAPAAVAPQAQEAFVACPEQTPAYAAGLNCKNIVR